MYLEVQRHFVQHCVGGPASIQMMVAIWPYLISLGMDETYVCQASHENMPMLPEKTSLHKGDLEDRGTAIDGGVVKSIRHPRIRTRFGSQTWHHMWDEFVGSLLCSERFFSRYSGFPYPQKPTYDFIRFALISVQCPQLVKIQLSLQ